MTDGTTHDMLIVGGGLFQLDIIEAARRLGAETVVFLDCGDGDLRTGTAEQDALLEQWKGLSHLPYYPQLLP